MRKVFEEGSQREEKDFSPWNTSDGGLAYRACCDLRERQFMRRRGGQGSAGQLNGAALR